MGEPVAELSEGLGFGLETLTDERRWIRWDDFIVVMERSEAMLGEARLGELLAAISRDPIGRGVRSSLSFAVSPRQLYALLVRWFGPSLYPVHKATLTRESGDQLRIVLEVPSRYRDSQVFFRTSASAFRYAPRLLGLADATVEAEIESHRAIYRVWLPASGTFLTRLRRVLELFTGARTAIDALADQQAELQRSYAALTDSYGALRERERRLEAEIEERRRAEAELRESREQLLHSQRLEAMGRLAGGIAHDFNNLMTTVLGYASMLLEEPSVEGGVESGLSEIRGAAERATRLTGQLLAFSRRQVLQPEVLDLNDVVNGIVNILSRLLGEDIELRTELSTEPLAIEADRGQIEQVILNLAVNARDAMQSGGLLVLRSHRVIAARGLDAPGGPHVGSAMARLVVTDTGSGIPAATRPHIFEPFFTTKEIGQGTGLGLSTVYGIVRQSGGTIEVESKSGEGTSFMLDLPLTERPLPDRATAEMRPDVEGGQETLLVVEDETGVRGLLRRMLEGAGYRVLLASGGDEAVQLAGTQSLPIDLLISDVVMRGLSGPELAAELRRDRAGLPVLLISGYPGEAHEIDIEETAFLAKPFSRDVLLAKVREVLDTRRG